MKFQEPSKVCFLIVSLLLACQATATYRGDVGITPKEWLLGFMRAGIDCVPVTDHNSGDWIDRLKAALNSEALMEDPDYQPLTLFPGIELSVNGGVHLLALFDPACSAAQVEAAAAQRS